MVSREFMSRQNVAMKIRICFGSAMILGLLFVFSVSCRDRGDVDPPNEKVGPSALTAFHFHAKVPNFVLFRQTLPKDRLSVGHGNTCVITTEGKLSCWGFSLGASDKSLPTILPHSEPFVQVSADNTHTCARTAAGEVWCAGWNDAGQLGATASEICHLYTYGKPEDIPCSGSLLRVNGLPPIAEVFAGYRRTCAISRDGDVYCWGMSAWGVLGVIPDDPCDCAKTPIKVPHLEKVHTLALGSFFSCALKTDGTVWCWGSNKDGQRGQGTRDERSRWDKNDKDAIEPPVQVPKLHSITEIAAGGGQICAADRARKKLWCWGANYDGQLGIGGNTNSEVPKEVQLPKEFGDLAALIAGGYTTCALDTSGVLYCWGNNLGDDYRQSPIPQRIQDVPPLAALGTEDGRYCGADRTGKIWCWGYASAPDLLGFLSKPGECDSGCWSPVTEIPGHTIEIQAQ